MIKTNQPPRNPGRFTYFILGFLILLLVYNKWFFSLGIMTHGDWKYFDPLTLCSKEIKPSVWSSLANGGFGGINIGLPHSVVSALWSLAPNCDSFALLERLIYFWPAVILSYFGAFYLIKSVVKETVSSVVGALYFSLNSYMLVITEGHITLVVAMSLVVVNLAVLEKLQYSESKNFAVLGGLVLGIATWYDARVFFLYAIMHFVYYLSRQFDDKKYLDNAYRVIKISTIIFGVAIALNFFWIYPFYFSGISPGQGITDRPLFGSVYMKLQNAIFLSHPFWTSAGPTSFVYVKPSLFSIVPASLALVAFIYAFRRRKLKFYCLLAVIGIFLSKQESHPFGNVYSVFYNYVPGFNAFRESSKFFFFTAIAYSVLLAAFMKYLSALLRSKSLIRRLTTLSVASILISIMVVNATPKIVGHHDSLFKEKIPPRDFETVNTFLWTHSDDFRVYSLPSNNRWLYSSGRHKVISAYEVFSIISETENYKSQIEYIFDRKFRSFLNEYSVRFLVIASDFPNDSFKDFGLSRKDILRALDSSNQFKKIDLALEDVAIYENLEWRRFIRRKTEIPAIVDSSDIKFQRINDSHFELSIVAGHASGFIELAESYDEDWKIYRGKISYIDKLLGTYTNKQSSPSMLTTLGLNRFDLNIFDSLSRDEPVTILYKPQIYAERGIVVSLFTFLCIVIFSLAQINKILKTNRCKKIQNSITFE